MLEHYIYIVHNEVQLNILLSFPNVDVFPWPRTKENFRLYPVSTVWGIGDDCEGQYSVILLLR